MITLVVMVRSKASDLVLYFSVLRFLLNFIPSASLDITIHYV